LPFWPKIVENTGEKIESSSEPVLGDITVCAGGAPSPATCTLSGVAGAAAAAAPPPRPGGAGLRRGEDVMNAFGSAAAASAASVSCPHSIFEKELNIPLLGVPAPGLGEVGVCAAEAAAAPAGVEAAEGCAPDLRSAADDGVGVSACAALSRGDHILQRVRPCSKRVPLGRGLL
jgi:hypothetical protein